MSKKYRLRVEVRHDGEKLEAGSICPEQFVEPLLKQGLLEPVSGKASHVPGNVAVSTPALTPVGDASDLEGEESEDLDSGESEGQDEESEEVEGDDGEVVEQPKAAPAKKAPAKRAVKKAS